MPEERRGRVREEQRFAMQFFYPDTPDLPLPDGHRFPAGKYRMLLDQVPADRIVPADRLAPSPTAVRADLVRAHSAD